MYRRSLDPIAGVETGRVEKGYYIIYIVYTHTDVLQYNIMYYAVPIRVSVALFVFATASKSL